MMMDPLSSPQALTLMKEGWEKRAVSPLWVEGDKLSYRVCLSNSARNKEDCEEVWEGVDTFGADALSSTGVVDDDGNLYKDFILFGGEDIEANEAAYQAEQDAAKPESFLSKIGTTSVILTAMETLFGASSSKPEPLKPQHYHLPESMWNSLIHKNSTLHVHTTVVNDRLAGSVESYAPAVTTITATTPITKKMPPMLVRPPRYLLSDFIGSIDSGTVQEEHRRYELSSSRVEENVDVQHFKPFIMSKIVPDDHLYVG